MASPTLRAPRSFTVAGTVESQAVPGASGKRVPGDFNFLSGGEAAEVGLVDKETHLHAGEIGLLQKQISSLHVCALLHGQGIDNAVERGADAGFAERVFGGVIGGLGFGTLRVHLGDFRRRVTVFLFLLEQCEVGLGAVQAVFGSLDFSRGGIALLLQTAEGLETALRGVALAAGFYQKRVEGKDFLVSASGGDVGLIGLRGGHLRLRVLGLAADVGVVELQKKLSFVHVVAFFDQQALDDRGDRRVGFEIFILERLNFAVGGNQAADGAALDGGNVDDQGRAARKKWG